MVGLVKISFVGNPKKKNMSNLLTGLPKGEAGKNKDRYNSTLQILKRFGNECASAIFDFFHSNMWVIILSSFSKSL